MLSDDANPIRRWLVVISLFLALLTYLVSSSVSGVYLDNVIRLVSGGAALAIGFLLVVSLVRA
ncbi:hypothetical protein C5B91_13630 [Haloferax sp. Atlit-10N]|uniref:Uncharacterized protein n=1 Tax=Haloferax prahovense (strain DSM 18310 / JCM 13924 / TL6) TaxID=1227461 RepID=M0GNN6_HALPT|nr:MULTISPECIES: hypothetical protein [Haloferax]ELZ73846.1 hypothetical protein C457_01135 [Haloferax prahovense DSM 18310]RDZ42842.1 hypothetical protein C5B86_14215 [Haloferax sp. Atlit-19N]RDZ43165.1 hypothetical protein C5B87_14460 [Haloferax sp. Atlit-16N]RDZ57739.1 hypothetical protein C5B91_13630 [Haloferax sp. Atlit-10N]